LIKDRVCEKDEEHETGELVVAWEKDRKTIASRGAIMCSVDN
jgi:hypothetical protein